MKWLVFFTLVLGYFLLNPFDASAQKPPKIKTEECTVAGVCGMCEKRIENAALINGVKMAEWDKETQILKVVYKPKKVSLQEIHKAVAESGHRTDKVEADKKAYSNLPKCCQYDDGVQTH